VNPVIVSSTFERFAGQYRSALFALLLTVLLTSFIDQLLFHPLLFTLSIGLLFMGDLGWLVQFLFCDLVGAKDALIILGYSQYNTHSERHT
jgi:hypothetical protein